MTAKENKKIKIVFWGTSEFAIPALDALCNAKHSIAAVITAPDKPAGRKQMLTSPPVKAWLMKHKIWGKKLKILQPEKLSDANFRSEIVNLTPDIFIVAAYGKIIPTDILTIPKYGALNVHPSLLPRWRGPSPIQYTILNGDAKTGVTIIKIDAKIDHGPILTNVKYQISNVKPTYTELHDILAQLGAKLLIETLPKYLAEKIMSRPQNETQATYSKILKKEDGHIDWKRSAEEIERMIRAFNPWPRAYVFWQRNEKKIKINIVQAQIPTNNQQLIINNAPGLAGKIDKKLLIQTGNGLLEITKLQLESKKPTNAQSFLNGYQEIIGQVLI